MEKDFLHKHLQLESPSVHCIGIGGIGVSAIAEYMLEAGFQVSGSDESYNSNCRRLEELGALIAPAGHRESNVPENCGAVVYTAAASNNNCELAKLLRQGATGWKRGEFVGEIALAYQRAVMITGTHGKSSTTAMLGWISTYAGKDPGLLLGAKYSDQSPRVSVGSGDILVAEADESDDSLGMLRGELALITNVDGDHAWTPQAEKKQQEILQRFARGFKNIIFMDSPRCTQLFGGLAAARALTAVEYAEYEKFVPEFMLGHERSNAVLALAGAEYLDVDLSIAAEALKKYPGIDRRLQEIYRSADGSITVVNDYAHHPTELASAIDVVRARYGADSSLLVVFQPHRYQRLHRYWDEFVALLSRPELTVKILPVFSAWEFQFIDALDSRQLTDAVKKAGGNAELLSGDHQQNALALAAEVLEKKAQAPLTVLIAGAGDVEKMVLPLADALKSGSTGA